MARWRKRLWGSYFDDSDDENGRFNEIWTKKDEEETFGLKGWTEEDHKRVSAAIRSNLTLEQNLAIEARQMREAQEFHEAREAREAALQVPSSRKAKQKQKKKNASAAKTSQQ